MLKKLLQIFSQNKGIALLIFLGSFTWSLTMVKSGIIYPYGMGFWGPNGHDGIWHIALAKSIANGSWELPIFSGEMIKNYHLGFDLILAIIHKLTFIPVQVLYFQILPPIMAVFIGFFVYKFVYLWRNSKKASFWAVFFVYFGGNWGWLINLARDQKLGGESMFWSQQSISTLINPPFALSLVFLFAGLYFLLKGLKEKNKRSLIIATFLFGVLVQIKIYSGILVLASLFLAGFWNILRRKSSSLFKVFTGSLVISILVFSPLTKDVGNTLIFRPFWFIETMMGFSDRLGWNRFGEAMVNYKLAGNWFKGIPAYSLAFIIFIFGNFGTRMIKIPYLLGKLKEYKKLEFPDIFLYSSIVLGILIPTFFVQSGTSWNTIQFMYVSLIFSGIIAGVFYGEFVEKKVLDSKIYLISSFAIIIFTLPTTFATLRYNYLPSRPPAKISNEELEALSFLALQSEGVVLTQLFSVEAADNAVNNPPRPLYLYESTAYVSALSGKKVFLEDQVNLEITDYDWVLRRKKAENYFSNTDSEENLKFIMENNIRYIYLVKNLGYGSYENIRGVDNIFENDEVVIHRVN